MNDTRRMLVEMPDGSTWAIPVQVVIDNRLAFYRREGTAEASDEQPGDYDIRDWAAGNMDWSDVRDKAVLFSLRPPMTPSEWQEGWVNGKKRIVS